MISRRAMLYMPGDDLHKIQKAITLGVDSICMDLEDGVALNRKEAARQTIIEALDSLNFGKAERLVRFNSMRSGLWRQDIEAITPHRPDGIVFPKCTDSAEVVEVCELLNKVEKRCGIPAKEIGLIVLIETALAVVNLPRICQADERLQALIFGAEDLAGDIGAVRTRDAHEMFYARSAVVLHASAFGLQAIDMVCNDYKDIEHLERESRQGAEMGFSGKQVIHPFQVPVVQEAYTPNEESISSAIFILRTFNEQQLNGVGAFSIDGKMVDMPVVKTAERLLERARAAGKTENR